MMTAQTQSAYIKNPSLANSLFTSAKWSWLWLIARLYVGYSWITSGWGKFGNPAWMESGAALKGFLERAVTIPEAPARPLIAFNWYRVFLQSLIDSGAYTWFAKLIVVGELLVGLALILGVFTGIAAFFGGFMNWNFMMAGTASTNPVLFTISILLILAWKTAGWWGVDRWLLKFIGNPKQSEQNPNPQVIPEEVCTCGNHGCEAAPVTA